MPFANKSRRRCPNNFFFGKKIIKKEKGRKGMYVSSYIRMYAVCHPKRINIMICEIPRVIEMFQGLLQRLDCPNAMERHKVHMDNMYKKDWLKADNSEAFEKYMKLFFFSSLELMFVPLENFVRIVFQILEGF